MGSALNHHIVLEAGKEYRLSQVCTSGMADLWFDGSVPADELLGCSASLYVKFIGSVFRNGQGYPDRCDDDASIPTNSRRAGMLNFKMVNFNSGEDQQSPGDSSGVHKDITQIRLLCMSPAPELP